MTINEFAVECKKKEIAAMNESKKRGTTEASGHSEDCRRWYFDGKASAYADVWELAAFGRRLSPDEYNTANEGWSKKVACLQL